MTSPNISRMDRLIARATKRTGKRETASNDVAAILFPRLVSAIRDVACASTGETTTFLRDVIYYGPNMILGAEVFTHQSVRARSWIQSARRCHRRRGTP